MSVQGKEFVPDGLGRLHQQTCTFVMLDVQEKLFAAMAGKEKLLRNSSILLEGAKILGIPFAATEQYPKGLGKTLPQLSSAFPSSAKVFEKLSFSAFADSAFRATLPPPPSQLVIFGIEAHICVLQTALDAQALGYETHVAADATSSRSEENWRLGLDRMGQAGVFISPTETIIFQLAGVAGTEEFKKLQALVK